MKKIELLALISTHKKDEARTELEEERLALLEDFLLTPDIQALKEDDDVSFDMFLKHASSAFPQLLPVLTFIAKLDEPFKKFIISSQGDFLKLLPKELQDIILGMLDKKELGRLSRTSSTLYYQTKRPELWRGPMIEEGCSPALFDELVRLNLVTDYQNLWRAFRQIVRTDSRNFDGYEFFRPNQIWQLLALSGEQAAVLHSLSLPGITMETRDGRASSTSRQFFDYLIHSGRVEAIDLAEETNPIFFSSFNRGAVAKQWLHTAVETGQMDMIKRIAAVTSVSVIKWDLSRTSSFNLADWAFLSGNVNTIRWALGLYNQFQMDAKKENGATNKFLKYAIASGCLPALEFLWELKTTGISIKWFNVAMNALEYAAVCGKIDVFQFILQHCSELGINPAQQPYLIHCAVLSGSKAMVDHASAYCTQRNINQTVQCQKIEGVGGNILHMAFRANNSIFFIG